MKDRISINPDVHFGKACVTGTRIPVLSVLELIGSGITFAEVIRDYYPDLKVEDVSACVKYAMDVLEIEDLHVAT